MKGTFSFKPLKAKLNHKDDWINQIKPYCYFITGSQTYKSQICVEGGRNPVWNDEIEVPLENDETYCWLELIDQERVGKDDNIGVTKINLEEISKRTSEHFLSCWYPLHQHGKTVGEILLEIWFKPNLEPKQNVTGGLTGITGTATQFSPREDPLHGRNIGVRAAEGFPAARGLSSETGALGHENVGFDPNVTSGLNQEQFYQ